MSKLYGVIVVDDEKRVRERIVQSFPWEQLGLQVIASASSGEEALRFMGEHMPDIVLTDIRMPGMNGLELAKQVKDRNPDMKIVILSAYDDFRYAQEAIRIGVQGYLLKPLAHDEFNNVFTRLVEEINAETEQHQWAGETEILLAHLIRNVGPIPTKQKFESLQLQRLLTNYSRIAICAFDSLLQRGASLTQIQQMVTWSERFWNGHQTPVLYYGSSLLLFLNDSKPISKMDVHHRLQPYISKLESMLLTDKHDYEMTIGVGNVYQGISMIPQSYHEAVFSVSQRHIKPCESIIYYQEIAYSVETNEHDKDLLIKSMIKKMLAVSGSDMKSEVASFFAQLVQKGYRFRDIQEMCRELLIGLKFQLEANGFDFRSKRTALDRVNETSTLSELQAWFLDLVAGIKKEPAESRTEGSDYVSKAKAYVSEHYSDKITLEEVAETMFINPSYFSSIFKKSTGQNFVDYVNEVRVRKAAHLIKSTHYRIKEISLLVGYGNFSYFNKVFKKIYGVRPLTYRSEGGESVGYEHIQ